MCDMMMGRRAGDARARAMMSDFERSPDSRIMSMSSTGSFSIPERTVCLLASAVLADGEGVALADVEGMTGCASFDHASNTPFGLKTASWMLVLQTLSSVSRGFDCLMRGAMSCHLWAVLMVWSTPGGHMGGCGLVW